MAETLAEAVAHAGCVLPTTHLDALADHADTLNGPGDEARARVIIPNPVFREQVAHIWDAWRREPATTGSAVAASLRTAAATVARLRRETSVDPVVTGPTTYVVPLRSTSAVVLRLIGEARTELLLTSFANYPPPWLLDALQAALDRGISLTLLLETLDQDGVEWPAAHNFDRLQGKLTILIWPREQREATGAALPRMHAKIVIADRRAALVTSANLTGNALDHSLEVGVLIRGGDVPIRLANHVDTLVARRVLRA